MNQKVANYRLHTTHQLDQSQNKCYNEEQLIQ